MSSSEAEHANSAKGRQTRERILSVATRLFAERGYEGTGIRDLEAAAGVNRGVVTYHFGNKDEIWKAAFSFSFLPYLDDFRSKAAVLRELDGRSRMRVLIAMLVRTSAERPHLNQLMIRENGAPSWRTDWILKHVLGPLREIMRDLGGSDATAQMFDGDPHVRYAFLGACNMVFSLPCEVKALFALDVKEEAFVQRHISVVTGLFEAFLAQVARAEEKSHV